MEGRLKIHDGRDILRFHRQYLCPRLSRHRRSSPTRVGVLAIKGERRLSGDDDVGLLMLSCVLGRDDLS